MSPPRLPTLLPAVCLALGVGCGFRLAGVSVPRAAALLALGAAWRGSGGVAAACLGGGMLLVRLRPFLAAPAIDPDRPVVLQARLTGHWGEEPFGWKALATAEVLRQGHRVERWHQRVHLSIPGAEPPPKGRRFRLTGFLRRSAGFANGGELEPGPWRIRVKSRRLLEPLAEPPAAALARATASLRRRVRLASESAPRSSAGAPLAIALALGDASGVPAELRIGLRRTGLAHLLAVSGLHVGILAGLAFVLSRPLPRTLRPLPGMAAVALYLAVAGPRPPLLRASVMAVLAWAAPLLERPPRPLNSLAAAVGLILIADPAALLELGFRLTVAATAGILLSGPLLARRWSGLPHGLGRALAASAAAQLFALPWALPAFHLLSPLAPFFNLIAVPWIAVALTLGLGWSALAAIRPEAAAGLLPLLEGTAWPLHLWAALPSGPGIGLPLTLSRSGALALAAALGLCLRRARLAALAGLVLLLALAWREMRPPSRHPELAMLDVGQGEAILLRDGAEALLVDGGGWRGAGIGQRVLLPALTRLGVRRLRALVLSHPDLDHCGGLVEIAAFLPVREIWTAPGWAPRGCAYRLKTLPGTRLRPLWAGESARLGRWRLAALHPAAGDRSGGNDRSLVLLAESGPHRVLLTGDLEAAGERRLLSGPRRRISGSILKLAHHGSSTSSSEDFLEAVSSRLALVSAGRTNPYGHPSERVLERLRRRGVRVLRTDRDGLIRLVFGPGDSVRCHLPGAPAPRR